MKKIAIIGAPGAGKTTLAKEMHSILNSKVIHLDRIFWKRDWRALSRDERIDILQELVREKQWIIEGSYLDLSEPRLEAADIIIFLDIHPLICLKRIRRRHCEDRGRFRRDIPLECTDKLTLHRMLKVLIFPFRERRWLEKKLGEFPQEKVIRISSAKEVKRFLAQPERYIQEKRQLDKIGSKGKYKISISTYRYARAFLNIT